MIVERSDWQQAAARLAAREASLVALWGEPGYAHMALLEGSALHRRSVACTANRYPSVGRLHAPAIRLERAMRDLHGLEAEGLPTWLQQLRDELLEHSYNPTRLRRVEIPKPGGKGVRVLSIPTIRDRVVQGAQAHP